MKKMLSRVLVLMLAMTMTLGMTVYVAAETSGAQEGTGGSGTLTETPFTPSVPTYRVIVDDAQKDQLKPDRTSASAGTTVTIKVADGVSTDAIQVLGKDGKAVELTKVNNTTYTFKMPACDVNVSGAVIDLRLNTTDHFAYIQGYPDGTFQPKGGLTRAEAATIFYRLLLDTSLTKSVSFSDVKAGSWYENAVKVLASKGVIAGYPDGSFKPNASVTRAEFCAMASRFFALEEGTVKFTDVPTTFWGYKYIASVVAKGWLSDSATAYQPNGAISRAEVVSIVNKMLGRSADAAFLAKGADGLKAFTDVKADDSCYLDVMEAANAHNYKLSGGKETWTGLK